MGQTQTKSVQRRRKAANNTVYKKIPGSKFSTSATGGLDSGTQSQSYLTLAPAEDDLSAGDEGERGAGFIIPRTTECICGNIIGVVIMAPIDDPMERDLAIFDLYDYDNPTEKLWAYIARPEVSKSDAKESFAAMNEVLMKVRDKHIHENLNFPNYVIAGPLKRLIYGQGGIQCLEHDPEWRGRAAMIVNLPSCGVFLSAVMALSPTGTVQHAWIAILVGLGLVQALVPLHKMGYIHRYVTPWNFLMLAPFKVEDLAYRLHHVDLSLVTKWPEKKRQLAIPFVGTIKYSSKRALTRHNQGPADDFISVIYIVAELISGKLPWRAILDINGSAQAKKDFPQTDEYKRLPHELRKLYQKLYRTYGLKAVNSAEVVEAFEEALQRKAGENWKLRDLPDWLTMPLESME